MCIRDSIDSVLNPSSGVIRADEIKELTVEKDKVDPSKTKIFVQGKEGDAQFQPSQGGRRKRGL